MLVAEGSTLGGPAVIPCVSMPGPAGDSRTYSLSSSTGGGPAAGAVSIPRLLFAFLRQRFTGTVTLGQREPAGTRSIWLRGGMPVFSDWHNASDRFGELLRTAGIIDASALEQALALQPSSGTPLGAVLVERGLIDEATRTNMLREQCMRKLTHVFAANATTGDAVVTALEHGKGNGDELAQINVLGLLLAGVDAHYDIARIQAEMGAAFLDEMVATPALPRYERQFGFVPRDASILQALSRGVTFERLQIPGVDPLRAARIIYTLWVSQMVRFGDDALQAIAKGATAAAAAQELGVSIGSQIVSDPKPKPVAAKPEPKPVAAPAAKPAATPPPLKPAATPPPLKPAATPPPLKPAAKPQPQPEPESESEPSVDDAEFEARLVALEAKVAAQANAFALFGLELDAERAEVRVAWADLSKTFHPDALEGTGRRVLRPRVEPLFAALSEAYGVLADKDQREKLRDAIAAGGSSLKSGDDTSTVVRNAFEAEMLAREADKLLRAKQWARALEMFERAYDLSPQDGDIEAALHYSRFRAGRGDQGHALTTVAALEKVIETQPICARAFYFCALIQLGIEDLQGAKRNFLQAATLDPRNIDSERQLRAIRMREHGPTANTPLTREAREKKKEDDKKKSSFAGLRGLFKKD
jgi:tetratricopeptide (TPR) repeat protein